MAPVTDAGIGLVAEEFPGAPVVGPRRTSRPLRAARRRRQRIIRWCVVAAVMAFFVIPLVAMVDFTTRLLSGKRSAITWKSLLHFSTVDEDTRALLSDGLKSSVILVLLTVVIMLVLLVPTMVWVRLRAPRLVRLVEFVCLLPLTIPAIVLVVGLAPIYRGIAHILSTKAIWLCFAYVILVLPYAYRALDAGLSAIDVKTLSEAARSLGSSWPGVIWHIVLPNIRSAVAGACFLAVALVLGEFTIANLLSKNNLQTSLVQLGAADPRLAMALALITLLLAFLLFFVLSSFGSRRRTGTSSPEKRSARKSLKAVPAAGPTIGKATR